MTQRLMILAPLALAWFAATAFPQAKPGNAENGKRLYMRNGCYQCHGTVGQGGRAGPRLAQIKLPVGGFIAFVRNPPSSDMPQYRVKIMSDQELADVYAHIKSFPVPLAANSIAILNQ
jgi:mono/diheme cytochrome c family protein